MPNEQQIDHRHVREHAPFQQRVLGLAAQLFFTFPELFTITSEPILDRMPIGIYIGDERGKLYYANPPFATMLGYENSNEFKQEVLKNGGLHSIYSDPSAREEWIKQHTAQQEPKNKVGKQVVSEQQLKRRDGSIITVRDTSVQIGTDFHGQPVYFGGIQDITKEVELRKELKKEAFTDSLTQLYSRKYFDEEFESDIDSWHTKGFPVSVIVMDVDKLKSWNDDLPDGHQGGDNVLRQIGLQTRSLLKKDTIIIRYGGDEVVIGLPVNTKEALEVAERLRGGIEAYGKSAGKAVLNDGTTLSVSIGVSSGNGTRDELFREADVAAYQSKSKGRNRVTLHTDDMREKSP